MSSYTCHLFVLNCFVCLYLTTDYFCKSSTITHMKGTLESLDYIAFFRVFCVKIVIVIPNFPKLHLYFVNNCNNKVFIACILTLWLLDGTHQHLKICRIYQGEVSVFFSKLCHMDVYCFVKV